MTILLDPSLIISKAASLARGDRYIQLREICESQKTISTARLLRILDEYQSSDCQNAIQLRDIADHLRRTTIMRPA